MDDIQFEVLDGGRRARITGVSRDKAGNFAGRHVAVIAVEEGSGRYSWTVETTLTCRAAQPVKLSWIEFNNVYPSGTGRCMLFAPEKRYNKTLMVDRDGTVWAFPHQHMMHYGQKISGLKFAVGAMAGFFGEALNPVVIVDESTLPPDWGICDMYYDLHCGARVAEPVAPGTVHRWLYRVRYLDAKESRPFEEKARHIEVNAEDYRVHQYPRLDLGRNSFSDRVHIDEADDASGFRQNPPVKVWDMDTGFKGRGALRITNEKAQETVWSAEPPTQIPSRKKLTLRALVKTQGVEGKGLFLRVRYHTFQWRPEPHIDWEQTLESTPVTGTTKDWVRIEVPALTVPKEHIDYLVWIDLVLDGKGVGWLTDVDVDQQQVWDDVSVPVGPRKPVPAG